MDQEYNVLKSTVYVYICVYIGADLCIGNIFSAGSRIMLYSSLRIQSTHNQHCNSRVAEFLR